MYVSTTPNYMKYLDTTYELAQTDKIQVIEIVKSTNKIKKEMIFKLIYWIEKKKKIGG